MQPFAPLIPLALVASFLPNPVQASTPAPGADGAQEDETTLEMPVAAPFVVEATAPTVPPPGVDLDLDDPRFATDIATAIDRVPGARVVHSGSSLARSELRVRGLGGPRLVVSLEGMPLDDPSGAGIDLADLDNDLIARATLLRGSEASLQGPGALAGTLELSLTRPRPGCHARLKSSLGSETTLRASSTLTCGGSDRQVAIASWVARTAGDFSYRPLVASAGWPIYGPERVRANNHHARSGLLLSGHWFDAEQSGQVVAHLARDHGGVAGLSGHPTPRARQSRDSLLLGGRTRYFLEHGVLQLAVSGRRIDARFENPSVLAPQSSHSATSTGRAALGLALERLLPQVSGRLSLEGTWAQQINKRLRSESWWRSGGPDASRATASGLGQLRLLLLSRRLSLTTGVRLDALSDVGVEPSLSAHAVAALAAPFTLELFTGRAFRPPTFHERYGPPEGYFRANPDLRSEDGIEGGVRLSARGDRAGADLTLFGARLSQAILYLNRNAYEVRPVNAGRIWRAGLELAAHVTPLRGVRQQVAIEILLSRLDATGAPLPTAPALRLHQRNELSLADLAAAPRWLGIPLRLFLDGRAQSASASNYFGELLVPAQATFDLGLALDLVRQISLALTVNNLFDVKTRVDLHQVPLPGRQLLATLSIGA